MLKIITSSVKFISLLFIFFLGNTIYSQTLSPSPLLQDIKSPGIADFIKYGNISSISNVGELKIDIPLLLVPVYANNPIELSLNYVGSGFRPNKRSGLVGYNSFLSNGGGVITRKVNKIPDDQYKTGLVPTDNNYTNGFLIGVKSKTHNALDVFNLSDDVTYFGEQTDHNDRYLFVTPAKKTTPNDNYETEPDIFSFNFNGISGNFFMGNDGIIRVNTNSPNNLKIDLSDLTFQNSNNSSSKPANSKIVITDNAGNKYHFGGELKNLEYSVSGIIDNNKFRGSDNPIISSWFLYKIEYLSGAVINFIYRDDSKLIANFGQEQTGAIHNENLKTEPALSTTPSPRDFVVLNEYYTYNSTKIDNTNYGSTGGSTTPSYSLQKIAILDTIAGDDFKIAFDYSRQEHQFNTRDAGDNNMPVQLTTMFARFRDIRLDKITLYNYRKQVSKKIDLQYEYLGGETNTNNSRMFLTSVKENEKPPYLLEYYPAVNLPKPITYGVDHWGFWNGRNDNSNLLIPWIDYSPLTGDYQFHNSDEGKTRDPNFIYALKGQLKKITYPTGGISAFIYEPHQYAKRLELRSTNEYIHTLYNETGVAGGTRIQKITDFNEKEEKTNEKTLFYRNNLDQPDETSSGILLKWPRYQTIFTSLTKNITINYKSANPIGDIISSAPVINYSEVTEMTNGNGFITYKFTDFVSHPDLFDGTIKSGNHFPNECVPMKLAENYAGDVLTDYSIERGKYMWIKYFDNSKSLKKTEEFQYNTDLTRYNKYGVRIHDSGPTAYANKLYHYHNYLTEKVTTEKLNGKNIINKENYYYSTAPAYNNITTPQDVLTKKSVITYLNEKLETKYKYPWDGYNGLNDFKTANISIPLSVASYRNDTKLIEQFTEYIKDISTNNILRPKNIYAAKFPNDLAPISPIGQLEKKATYYKYDIKGNILEASNENGMHVAYIWGYNNTKLLAKIENVNYADIDVNLITNLQNASNTKTESELLTLLTTLRNSAPLQKSMITTYTYLPLVGVTTVTDSKGIRSYYKYDDEQRLSAVLDKDLNVLQKYCYNYKGQNIDCSNDPLTPKTYKSVAKSGPFTRNNCLQGGTPESITYNQVFGAVVSEISQVDADNKGLAKFNTDGQAYANDNAKCSFTSIALSESFTRENCATGTIGGSIVFDQAAGAETSYISQDDANLKGRTKFNLEGKTYANTYAKCYFQSIAREVDFTRNNCLAGGNPGMIKYSQIVGAVLSEISQEDADVRGLDKFNNDGQAYANANAKCTFKSAEMNGSFTRNNCVEGGTPESISYSQAAGVETSDISQDDANLKGALKFNSDGQGYANNNAKCTFSSIALSDSFSRENCISGTIAGSIPFNQAAGAETSYISQDDANSKGLIKFNLEGKAYANTYAKCYFQSIARETDFIRNNCLTGGNPGMIKYSQLVGAILSETSQEDADLKGLDKFNSDGQAYANANAKCTFKSAEMNASFTRNDCAEGGTPESITFSQAAGVETSDISQDDANFKGAQKFNIDGKAYAIANARCTFKSSALSDSFLRNNCTSGGTTISVVFNQVYGAETSYISQDDANAKGETKFNIDGQEYANAIGKCYFKSIARSKPFIRDNCAIGGTPDSIVYTQTTGDVISDISQEDADLRGLAKFNADGLAYANANANCVFNNTLKTGSFTRNNCSGQEAGPAVIYTVSSEKYSSTISQADADRKADEEIAANGQAYANINGKCIFRNLPDSADFRKNDCSSTQIGSTTTYIVPAGRHTAYSQEDANYLAQQDISQNGQNYANQQGMCAAIPPEFSYDYTFSPITRQLTIYLSSTNGNHEGATFNLKIYYKPDDFRPMRFMEKTGLYLESGKLSAEYTFSLTAVDVAFPELLSLCYNFQGQQGICNQTRYLSVEKSGTFINNCPGGQGVAVIYTVAAGAYVSIISQATADTQAENDLNENGPIYATNNGKCSFNNIAKSGTYIKNNCPPTYTGSTMNYIVPAGKHTSYISQEDANNMAQSDLVNNGQNYANTNGTCTAPQAEFLYSYTYTKATKEFKIFVTATNSNHNGATLYFRINYIPGNTKPELVTEKTYNITAGQTAATFTFSLIAYEIVEFELSGLVRH